jgi:hypothetical protein
MKYYGYVTFVSSGCQPAIMAGEMIFRPGGSSTEMRRLDKKNPVI